jgi:ketosteroid isomerase-like protein
MSLDVEAIVARLEAVEADIAIRNLIARYAMVMDDRDVASIPSLFTKDARVTSGDGVMNAQGRDFLVDFYEGRFKLLGATHHYTYGMEIAIDGPTTGHGRISGGAEVFRNGVQQVVALRYLDKYEKEDGAWRIAHRHMLYCYYCPLDEYPTILSKLERNLTYGRPIEADFPENTAPFKEYMARHGG